MGSSPGFRGRAALEGSVWEVGVVPGRRKRGSRDGNCHSGTSKNPMGFPFVNETKQRPTIWRTHLRQVAAILCGSKLLMGMFGRRTNDDLISR